MKNKIVIIFLALALVLTACAPKLVSVHSAAPLAAATAAPAEALKAYGQGGGITNETSGVAQMPATDNSNPAGSPATATQDRLVLTNVDLSIVVADPQKKMDSIAQMAKDMGGFVVSSNLSPYYLDSGTTVSQGTISIRIPADKLEQALTQIKTGVGEVRSEARTGQDVTAQYVDLQSSLRNLEQEETDLQDIMDEAKNNPNSNTTSKTQDVLTVYNQIVSVRGQIEQIKGQMQYYEQSSAYSLVNVNLIPEETVKPIQIGGWKPQGVANESIQSLIKFWQGFVDFLIRLVLLILPVLITILGPIALVIWGIIALVKRRKARKAKAA